LPPGRLKYAGAKNCASAMKRPPALAKDSAKSTAY